MYFSARGALQAIKEKVFCDLLGKEIKYLLNFPYYRSIRREVQSQYLPHPDANNQLKKR